MIQALTISALNKLPKDDFAAALAPVFDEIDDPWIAERCWNAQPFKNSTQLYDCLMNSLDRACNQEKLDLLARQPSVMERKGGLYFRRFSPDQQAAFVEANTEYRARFGYHFICACMKRTPQKLLAAIQHRKNNDARLEKIIALAELGTIAQVRVERMFSGQNLPIVLAMPGANARLSA